MNLALIRRRYNKALALRQAQLQHIKNYRGVEYSEARIVNEKPVGKTLTYRGTSYEAK